jgi:hypothetical protein
MKTIESRLSKLEQRLAIAGTAPRYLVILNDRELAHIGCGSQSGAATILLNSPRSSQITPQVSHESTFTLPPPP